MPSPQRTPNGGYKARKRIPKDVADEYGRLYGQRLEAKLSIPPGMSEGEARQRYGEWLAEHEGRVKAIRAAQAGEGQSLTEHEARALAGRWHTWWTARHANADPARLDEDMDEVQAALQTAAGDDLLSASSSPLEAWALEPEVRARVRPVVADVGETAQFLAGAGIVLNNPARDCFLDCLVFELAAALRRVKTLAVDGAMPASRGQPVPASATTEPGDNLDPLELFEKWRSEQKPARSTVETWRNFFKAMREHFVNRSAGSIAESEARQWIKSLVTTERTANTVKNNWLRASNAIFEWAVGQTLISRNPFAGVKLAVPKKVLLREHKGFRDGEAATILRAASAIADVSRPLDAAKRWVPWVCAYSGARPGEITQLRAEDVFEQDGCWAIRVTPEAGSVKTRRARVFPIHEHLIEQGFVIFAREKANGPLFYDPARHQRKSGPVEDKKPGGTQVRQRLAEWVRSLGVDDQELSPNHGWRHTFKQVAERCEISERVHDYITGHTPKTVGRTYGSPTLRDMFTALKRFPRYDLTTQPNMADTTSAR